MTNIEQNLSDIKSTLESFPQAPRLLAVSKTKPTEVIERAYKAGQLAFGENYVQEASEKINALKHLDKIEWHFIGPIQSNKCKQIAQLFNWVQSLDRIKVAEKLNDSCPAGKKLQVCVQLNIDQEKQKAGISPEALNELCTAVVQLPRLELRGLMAIPKPNKSISEQHSSFARIAEHFKKIQTLFPEQNIDTLSMGMSSDYAIALSHGATLIRIGSALFGERT